MKKELDQVLKYIEENIRVTDQTSIEYLDPKGHVERLSSKQNHVIFGRRGSGKSLLLKSLANHDIFSIAVNLEDYKDVSFPNSIIHVLKKIIKEIKIEIVKEAPIWKPLRKFKSKYLLKDLDECLSSLELQLTKPDIHKEVIKKQDDEKVGGVIDAKVGGIGAKVSSGRTQGTEVTTTVETDKLDTLKNNVSELTDLITRSSGFLNRHFFLILDDFYFIRRSEQPYFIDFFHRVSKNTPLYLKIATIKQRSSLYTSANTYVGVEIGHDVQELNLDYSLEDFPLMVIFMRDLLEHINKKADVNLNYNDIFTDKAFRFLCLASGGVPRDFFSLFIPLGKKLRNEDSSITKPQVIEASMTNIPNKLSSLKTDSSEEGIILEAYLEYIKKSIIAEKKWNAFLVSNSEVLKYPQIHQAIKTLVDLRFLHVANSNISDRGGDGSRYSAYLVDVGLFSNANPRDFMQVEPGTKDAQGREDKVRTAPKINLETYTQYIDGRNFKEELMLSE